MASVNEGMALTDHTISSTQPVLTFEDVSCFFSRRGSVGLSVHHFGLD